MILMFSNENLDSRVRVDVAINQQTLYNYDVSHFCIFRCYSKSIKCAVNIDVDENMFMVNIAYPVVKTVISPLEIKSTFYRSGLARKCSIIHLFRN